VEPKKEKKDVHKNFGTNFILYIIN